MPEPAGAYERLFLLVFHIYIQMELTISSWYQFIFALLGHSHELSLRSSHRNYLMIQVLILTLPMPLKQGNDQSERFFLRA